MPLEVGDLLTRTIALYFRRFLLFFGVFFLPNLGIVWVSNELILAYVINQNISGFVPDEAETMLAILGLVVFLLIYMLVLSSIIIQMASDVLEEKRLRFGRYLARALRFFPAIIASTIVMVTLLWALPVGAIAMVLVLELEYVGFFPALSFFFAVLMIYILARFWVFIPSIVVEDWGFRGIIRASRLSRNYRWPIAITLFLLLGTLALLNLLFTEVIGFVAVNWIQGGAVSELSARLIVSFLSAGYYSFVFPIFGIFTTCLFMRLREIKEGFGLSNIAAVFE